MSTGTPKSRRSHDVTRGFPSRWFPTPVTGESLPFLSHSFVHTCAKISFWVKKIKDTRKPYQRFARFNAHAGTDEYIPVLSSYTAPVRLRKQYLIGQYTWPGPALWLFLASSVRIIFATLPDTLRQLNVYFFRCHTTDTNKYEWK